MSQNLGQSSLRRRRRAADPMTAFDTLPLPARQWMSHAALPWSPASVKRIWARGRAKGLSTEARLRALTDAEARALARDRHHIG